MKISLKPKDSARFSTQLTPIAALCVCLASGSASASGFALIEQSASAQGLSYAGAAAMTDDASVMWFNPAQMTKIQGTQAIAGVHFISPKVQFNDDGTGTGGGNSDGGTLGIVPNLYWKSAWQDWHLGLGLNVPYGQHLDYGETWVGRYHATETDLKTLQINPNIARQLNQAWSVGFGLNAQYVDVLLAQKINQGALGDADAKVTGNNWAYGFNLGASYQPNEALQVGLSYRSGFSHKVEGKVEYKNINSTIPIPQLGGATFGQIFYDADATADVNLPASASLAMQYAFNEKLNLLASTTWTAWSEYDQLVVKFDNNSLDSQSNQDFGDSWRYALGAQYQASDSLLWRTGIAWDQAPVPGAENRSPRTPDSDRYWLSVGLGYQITPKMTLDVAYSHLFAAEAKLDYEQQNIALVGEVDAAVDIFSAQLVWRY